jgi:hypothetical protein
MANVLVETKQLNNYIFPKNQYFLFYKVYPAPFDEVNEDNSALLECINMQFDKRCGAYKCNNPVMSVQTLIFSTPSTRRAQRISADSATSAMEKNTGKEGLSASAPVCNCASRHKNPELKSGQVLPKIN